MAMHLADILRLFFILVLVVSSTHVFSQSKRINKIVTLRNQAKAAGNDLELAGTLNRLTSELIHYNLDSAIKYSEESRRLIENHKMESEYGLMYINLFKISLYRHAGETPLHYLILAEQAFEKNGNLREYIVSVCEMSNILISHHETGKAIDLLTEGLAFVNKYEIWDVKAYVLFLLGKSEHVRRSYALAESYFLESIELHKETGQNPTAVYSELGNMYFHQGKHAMAREIYYEAVPHVKEADDNLGMGYILSNIGKTEIELGKYAEALSNFNVSMEAREKINYDDGKVVSHIDLSAVYLVMNNRELAFEHINTAISLLAAKESLEMASAMSQKGRIFLETMMLDSAAHCLLRAGEIYRKMSYSPGELYVYTDFLRLYVHKGDQENTRKYYDLAIEQAGEINNDLRKIEAEYLLALFDLKSKNFDRAAGMLEKLQIPGIRAPKLTVEILAALLEAYYRAGKEMESEACLSRLCLFTDSINYYGLSSSLAYTSAKHELSLKDKKLSSSVSALSQMQRWVILLCIGFLCAVISAFVIKKQGYKKGRLLALNRERLNRLERKKNILLEAVEEEKKSRLEEKKEKLEFVRSKNFFLAELKEMVSENIDEKPLAIRSDIKLMLSSIQHQIGDAGTGFDHDLMLVEEEFLSRLKKKFPELTSKEKRLCIYIKMNFNNLEIATFSNVQASSVEKSKFRLKQKFGLTANDDLREFIKLV